MKQICAAIVEQGNKEQIIKKTNTDTDRHEEIIIDHISKHVALLNLEYRGNRKLAVIARGVFYIRACRR